jgi:glycosyltransferase involved in cell wall biosynthesis
MYKQNSNPLVSVITPTFNRAHILPRAVKSMLQQTHSNFELIIIDDCSSDNTREVIEELMQSDKRIHFIQLDRNQGASAARNMGLNAAKGDYITFIDSDDEYDSRKIERQLTKFLESTDEQLGVVTCGRKDFRKGVAYNEWVPTINTNVLSNLFNDKRMGAGTPFLMVTKDVLQSGVRFDTNINVVEDFDFVVQSLMNGFTFDVMSEPLVYVHHDEEERNFNYERGFKAREYLYKKYNSYLKAHSDQRKAFLMKSCFFYIEMKHDDNGSQVVKEVKAEWPLLWSGFSLIKKMPKGTIRNAAIKMLKANLR